VEQIELRSSWRVSEIAILSLPSPLSPAERTYVNSRWNLDFETLSAPEGNEAFGIQHCAIFAVLNSFGPANTFAHSNMPYTVTLANEYYAASMMALFEIASC
jgi:hypothetical protein